MALHGAGHKAHCGAVLKAAIQFIYLDLLNALCGITVGVQRPHKSSQLPRAGCKLGVAKDDLEICVGFRPGIAAAKHNGFGVVLVSHRKRGTAPEQRSILLKGHLSAEKLVITISNFYNGAIQISDRFPQTTKADQMHHGIGLTSVRRSVEKYGGVLTFRTAPEQRLIVTILLPASCD